MLLLVSLLALMPYYVLLQSADFSDPTLFAPIDDARPKWSSLARSDNSNVPVPIASAPILIVTTTNKPSPQFGAVHVRAQQPQRPFVRSNQFAANGNRQPITDSRPQILSDAPPNVRGSARTVGQNDSLPGSRSLFGPFGGFGGGPGGFSGPGGFGGPGGPAGIGGPFSPPGTSPFIGNVGPVPLGAATGALIGAAGGPFPLPPHAAGIPLSQQKFFRFEHLMTQVGPFQKVHENVFNLNEGQTFHPILGVSNFHNGEGRVRDFDNAAALGFGPPPGVEFTGGAAPFIGGGGFQNAAFGGGFPPNGGAAFGPLGFPPNCECRLIPDCRDVSVLARQLPVSSASASASASASGLGSASASASASSSNTNRLSGRMGLQCPPGLVPCCNEPRPLDGPLLPPPLSAPIISAPPPPFIGSGRPPLPVGGPPPPYIVKDIGCGLKGTNPLARVLDIEAIDPKFADAEFGEFPWMAAILRADHTYACGGALIKPRAVVTAAHCVNKLKFEDIIVRLGEYDVESTQELPYQDILVTDVVVHGGYHSGTLANDIAVLILAEPTRLSSYIRPVCLPPFHDYLSFKCTVTGWGKNLPNGMFSRILKKVDVPVVDQGFCENEYRKSPELGPFFNLDHSFVCAGAPGKDACYGDGGAPLVCEYNGFWRLVGLVSWGIGCGQYPGVYVDITKFVPWIYDVFAKYTFLL